MVPLALYTPIPFLLLASGGSELLLQLITGQTCVTTKTIQVVFSNLSGFGRRPVFHTCGYLVEIPDTYRNYKEFESEMKNIMSSDVLHFDLS
jgi:hypothetical protein